MDESSSRTQQQASVSSAAAEEESLGRGLLGSLWALLAQECKAPAVAAGVLSSLAASATLLVPEAAWAYTPAVDKSQAEDIILNVLGIAFTVTFALFLLRVVNKRASRATSIKLARDRLNQPDARDLMSDEPVTPLNCLGAGLFAAVISYGLWNLTHWVDETLFLSRGVSDQYTVQQLTMTIRTAVTGLMYLATFLFGANAVGLTGLSLQLLIKGKPADATSAGGAPPAAPGAPTAAQDQGREAVGAAGGKGPEPKP